MARILILYTTVEGHTARIAERIVLRLKGKGHVADIHCLDAGAGLLPDLATYDAVMVGASIHYGRHPRILRTLVRRQSSALAGRPGAFFSVSLSAGGPGAKPAAAQRYLDRFLRETGWRPQQTASFAGALQYSKYGPLKRLVMICFVGLAGGNTDTSGDYEYTDWNAVESFADAFALLLKAA
jgi:menaquinone-dependent protoporphyrinogen oxidase